MEKSRPKFKALVFSHFRYWFASELLYIPEINVLPVRYLFVSSFANASYIPVTVYSIRGSDFEIIYPFDIEERFV